MASRTAMFWCTVLLGVACLLAAGCGSGDSPAPPEGKKDTLERESRLWPDVPPPPEPRQGVTGSLTPPTGEEAAEGATEGTEGTETGEGAGEGAEPAGGGETTTGGTTSGGSATTSGGGSAGATMASLPAAVRQAASALSAKAPDVQSVAFDMEIVEEGGPQVSGGPPMPGPPEKGHVEAMPPDKIRIEGTGDMQGKPAKILMVMNGSKMWLEAGDPATGQPAQVITMDLSAMPGAKTSGSPVPFVSPRCDAVLGQLAGEVAFRTAGDANLNNELCKTFEGPSADGTTRVWFSQSDGLVRRIQEMDANGNTTNDVRISNIQVNPSLAATRFDYTPPDGVPVMDMAELMKQMMEGMGEAMKQGMQGATP
jgi:outer membrane lipoprotein-sorting protein